MSGEVANSKSKYATHRPALAAGTRHAPANTGNDDVGIQNKLGLKKENQWWPSGDTLNIHRRYGGSDSAPLSIP